MRKLIWKYQVLTIWTNDQCIFCEIYEDKEVDKLDPYAFFPKKSYIPCLPCLLFDEKDENDFLLVISLINIAIIFFAFILTTLTTIAINLGELLVYILFSQIKLHI